LAIGARSTRPFRIDPQADFPGIFSHDSAGSEFQNERKTAANSDALPCSAAASPENGDTNRAARRFGFPAHDHRRGRPTRCEAGHRRGGLRPGAGTARHSGRAAPGCVRAEPGGAKAAYVASSSCACTAFAKKRVQARRQSLPRCIRGAISSFFSRPAPRPARRSGVRVLRRNLPRIRKARPGARVAAFVGALRIQRERRHR
jgi:hypothetical protein